MVCYRLAENVARSKRRRDGRVRSFVQPFVDGGEPKRGASAAAAMDWPATGGGRADTRPPPRTARDTQRIPSLALPARRVVEPRRRILPLHPRRFRTVFLHGIQTTPYGHTFLKRLWDIFRTAGQKQLHNTRTVRAGAASIYSILRKLYSCRRVIVIRRENNKSTKNFPDVVRVCVCEILRVQFLWKAIFLLIIIKHYRVVEHRHRP